MEDSDKEINQNYSGIDNVSVSQNFVRKELYLRGEVDELRNEINSLRSRKAIKVFDFLNSMILIRAIRRLIKLLYKKYYDYRFLKKSIVESNTTIIDVIVPVYKNLELLRNLLKTIDLNKNENINKIIIVDDSGQPGYENAINDLILHLSLNKNIFTIIKNSVNLGFKESVNTAWHLTESEIVVLINSDIELPSGWIQRLLAPFEIANVALVTPLATNSGANLTLNLQSRANWNIANKEISRLKPTFPDACTAIGYCLAIRKKAILDTDLFSEEYFHGYGEDTDLHFRIKENGFRSVVADNLIVWHKSAGSYKSFINIDDFKKKNAAIFFEKWGKEYQQELLEWEKLDPIRLHKKFVNKVLKKTYNVDYLVIQLSTNSEIGGIQQLNSLYQEMVLRQINVGTLYLNFDLSIKLDESKLVFYPNEINKIQPKKIIFSGLDAFEFIKNAPNLSKAKQINFLQGPDYLFPGNENRIDLFIESLVVPDLILTQSPYLSELAETLGAGKVTTATLGPMKSIFFDRGLKKEKILLVSARRDPDKGLRFALPAMEFIRNAGWEIIGFGDLPAPELEVYFDNFLGRISRSELANIYQKASLLLDLSIYEGLGLTILEAGMCGVRPILNKKGGSESLEKMKNELIYISNPLDLNEIIDCVLNFDLEKAELERESLVRNSSYYAWENGIDLIIQKIENV